MSDVQELNARFGIARHLVFREDDSGLIVADIENPLASAQLSLQGAHLMFWRPRATPFPVVWLSDEARLASGKFIHSGVPVCWPWFGNHESDSSLPSHGFARTAPWELVETGTEPDGATRITLRLVQKEEMRALWPYSATLELTIVVGDSLRMELVTSNTDTSSITIGKALHTYFQVGDISQTSVLGLDGATYADKVQNFERTVQQGAVTFSGETDRVYLDTEAECVIEDAALRRRIRITKSGSRSTVVWTPWKEKGDKLGDLGEDGWRRMLCVESANAMDNQVTVPAGCTHTLAVEYRTEPLQ